MWPVSEADRIIQTVKGSTIEFAFDFPYPVHAQRGISLVASRRFEVSRDTYKDIELSTYLFPKRPIWRPATWNG